MVGRCQYGCLFLFTGRCPFGNQERDNREPCKHAFRLLNEWRKDVFPEYLFAYGVPEDYVLLPPEYGMMMCCVEKAVRSALEFGYSHPDDLVWRSLFAELMNWPNEN